MLLGVSSLVNFVKTVNIWISFGGENGGRVGLRAFPSFGLMETNPSTFLPLLGFELCSIWCFLCVAWNKFSC